MGKFRAMSGILVRVGAAMEREAGRAGQGREALHTAQWDETTEASGAGQLPTRMWRSCPPPLYGPPASIAGMTVPRQQTLAPGVPLPPVGELQGGAHASVRRSIRRPARESAERASALPSAPARHALFRVKDCRTRVPVNTACRLLSGGADGRMRPPGEARMMAAHSALTRRGGGGVVQPA